MPKLSGSSVLITGGATGIGRAVVHHFVEEGARLCVLCVNDEQASSLRGEFGAEVETVIGDVRSLADNQRAAALAVERFGGPEIDKLIEGMTPLGFAAKPEDHVALYALLACPVSARYVTGTTILSDGGIGVG
ncbi:SDR family NAD(P)-dependent oxidoreductase [Henriciella mobilis]|uniref:2,3-dihydroxy-2,3-dihydrophenylpropionate dehydrogenase n=1 Tax=Hyphomonas oceanitis SCH89 TaxID=1280953 RepID=A0A059G229_9PROT|nr:MULTISPECIES: SDR family oxidoreductase [Hyphomonadaceae]KDA00794.1 2,3-dihydroxy-2,3-dihydrophenylpropionate dehydrogenase [Hyphomonas oceanitis SCH89]MCK5921907.1 SDR family oxidoreductase [Methylococcales bacterium]RIJ18503.1 SDR family NAD(P)-dependent oxidoreductase [Henriciella mobilis]RIJ23202.1 SDR family NAD(P)-dependent oxidoreductase [Henriciella mobilis]